MYVYIKVKTGRFLKLLLQFLSFSQIIPNSLKAKGKIPWNFFYCQVVSTKPMYIKISHKIISFCLTVSLSTYPSIYLSTYLSIYPSVCLSILFYLPIIYVFSQLSMICYIFFYPYNKRNNHKFKKQSRYMGAIWWEECREAV